MVIKVRCPHCDTRLTVPEGRRGQRGRCPSCMGLVPLEADAAAPAGVAAPEPPLAVPQPSATPLTHGQGAAVAAGPSSDLGAGGADPRGSGDAPLVTGQDDGAAYDLELVVTEAPAVPIRAGAEERPKKSKRQRERELEDLRVEGNRYLWKIRLLLLGLGLLMLAYNAYVYTTIEEGVAAFKLAVTSNPRVTVDRAKLDAVANALRTALTLECALYFLLGAGMCGLAALIHKAPLLATWAALGTYVGAWVVDVMLIQALFGEVAAGQALFNLGTLVKLGIIGGLWHGVQVGQAYQEQIIGPQRELSADGP